MHTDMRETFLTGLAVDAGELYAPDLDDVPASKHDEIDVQTVSRA